jgi:hypothetical protein
MPANFFSVRPFDWTPFIATSIGFAARSLEFLPVYRRYAITDSAMLQRGAIKLTALHAPDANYQSTAKVPALQARM